MVFTILAIKIPYLEQSAPNWGYTQKTNLASKQNHATNTICESVINGDDEHDEVNQSQDCE